MLAKWDERSGNEASERKTTAGKKRRCYVKRFISWKIWKSRCDSKLLFRFEKLSWARGAGFFEAFSCTCKISVSCWNSFADISVQLHFSSCGAWEIVALNFYRFCVSRAQQPRIWVRKRFFIYLFSLQIVDLKSGTRRFASCQFLTSEVEHRCAFSRC